MRLLTRARLRRLGRVVLGLAVAVVTFGAAGAAGYATSMASSYSAQARGTVPADWPAKPAQPGRLTVAVVAGSTGSVVSDALGPYEVFGRSERFHVYTVSTRRAPVALSGGLSMVPDHTFADVDAGRAAAPDVVVVPAVVSPGGGQEAPLRDWVRRQADRGVRILGVCAGSRVLAEAGVLDGRRATSFWARIGQLERGFPEVSWVRGERYVEDGHLTTTAGVSSGIVGALRLVERLAGTAEAERIGAEVGYPGWAVDGPTDIAVNRYAPADLPYLLNVLFPWLRPTLGVGLADGVGELDVAAVFEVYSATSFTSRAVPVAGEPVVVTRHGLTLLAEPVTAAVGDDLDRLVVPGSSGDPDLLAWATGRGLPVERPHAERRPGESSFDPLLRDLAGRGDVATARATAKFIEYPVEHLTLSGAPWPWRPTVLLALSLTLAVAAGLVPTAVRRLRRRYRGASGVSGVDRPDHA